MICPQPEDWLQIDLGSAILDKYEYNKSRIGGLGQDGD